MGQDISSSTFTSEDFCRFQTQLRQETQQLADWFRRGQFAMSDPVGGFEIEAWLIDRCGQPAPLNQVFLERMADPLVVPELSVFNIEINTPQLTLQGSVLRQMHANLEGLWQRCQQVAATLDATVMLIGIPPTVRVTDLTLQHMSCQERYRAINQQILSRRHGRAMRLSIYGTEVLHLTHPDVMLEAATTSFQTHLQVTPDNATALFNAALVASAPVVAITANSPLLFGKVLWQETRIPLFEQGVALLGGEQSDDASHRRVSFGGGYLKHSLLELFNENLSHYPPLLPVDLSQENIGQLPHLRLHNGTIWRWNRPLLGFEPDGTPHLRIEHRAMPAGPSILDTIANAAFYYGLIHGLARLQPAIDAALDFGQCRANFYAAARDGLQAEVVWINGQRLPLQRLMQKQLLPLAQQGLLSLHIDPADIDDYLAIIAARVATGHTGAHWQRHFLTRCGHDLSALTLAYRDRQQSGQPVHEWS